MALYQYKNAKHAWVQNANKLQDLSYGSGKVYFLRANTPIASSMNDTTGNIGYTHMEATRLVYVFRREHGVSQVNPETISFPTTALLRLSAFMNPSFGTHFEQKLKQARASKRHDQGSE